MVAEVDLTFYNLKVDVELEFLKFEFSVIWNSSSWNSSFLQISGG